jgi:hypothetical protein
MPTPLPVVDRSIIRFPVEKLKLFLVNAVVEKTREKKINM